MRVTYFVFLFFTYFCKRLCEPELSSKLDETTSCDIASSIIEESDASRSDPAMMSVSAVLLAESSLVGPCMTTVLTLHWTSVSGTLRLRVSSSGLTELGVMSAGIDSTRLTGSFKFEIRSRMCCGIAKLYPGVWTILIFSISIPDIFETCCSFDG